MPLLHEKRGAVAIITLSRGQARNAWGEDYNTGLKELLPQLEEDREVRCVILTGDDSGNAFSAGDLSKPLLLEQPFSLRVDGLRLTGRIDRVDRHPDAT